eukprot:g4595.t1
MGECEWVDELKDTDFTETIFDWGYWVPIVVATCTYMSTPALFSFFYAAKGGQALDIREELTIRDNKAFAVALAGFLAGVALILHGAIADFGNTAAGDWGGCRRQTSSDGARVRGENLAMCAAGIAIGLALLMVSVKLDRVMLTRTVDEVKSVLDKNVASGVVEAAHFVSSGLTISGSLYGWSYAGWGEGAASIVILWALSQALFFAVAELFQKLTPFDMWQLVQEGNVAVAIAYAGQLVSISNLVQGVTSVTYELPTLCAVVGMGAAILLLTRMAMDMFVFPGERFNKEISVDRNWGVAVLVAATQVVTSEVLSRFMVDPCVASADISSLKSQTLAAKLKGTDHLDKLLTADRAYAVALTILVIALARLAFSLPFVLRKYRASNGGEAAGGGEAPATHAQLEKDLSVAPAPVTELAVVPAPAHEATDVGADEAGTGGPGAAAAAGGGGGVRAAAPASVTRAPSKSSLLNEWRSFDLDTELVQKDNKALAVAFAGYMAAIGLMLAGDMTGSLSTGGESVTQMGENALYSVVWALIGMLLMLLSHFVNDYVLLSSFANTQSIVSGQNVAAGVSEAGSYIAAGLVTMQVVAGADRSEEADRWVEFASCALWFGLSHLVVCVYARLFEKYVAAYDQQEEVQRGNVAAGLYMALHLIA